MQGSAQPLTLTRVVVCGATIVTLSMGIRHGFGLWLRPVIQARDWTRESFSLVIAIQNSAWGLAGIFAAATVQLVPVLALVIALQRYLVAGLMAGSVKA